MGVIMWVVVYFMNLKIQEVHQFVPKISYDNNSWIGYYNYSEWIWWIENWKAHWNVRVFDINKVKETIVWYWEVQNQLVISLKKKNDKWILKSNKILRSEIQNFLKDNFKYRFIILNNNFDTNEWVIDFDLKSISPWEVRKVFEKKYEKVIVSHKEVILPSYFNATKIWDIFDINNYIR